MGFNRYRCVLDRIFLFSKLPEYRHRFHFRKYRTIFVSDEKNVKTKVMESRGVLEPCGLCEGPKFEEPQNMKYILLYSSIGGFNSMSSEAQIDRS